MGTDTFTTSLPCLCGRGQITKTTSTPDHAWVSTYNVHHSYEINCVECSREYVVRDNHVVRRVDQAAHDAAKEAYWTGHKAFSTRPEVATVKSEFAKLLETQRSVAAIYRLLKANGFTSYSDSGFRRNWTTAADWIELNFMPRWLPKMLALLQRDLTQFDSQLSELDSFYATIPNVPNVRTLK